MCLSICFKCCAKQLRGRDFVANDIAGQRRQTNKLSEQKTQFYPIGTQRFHLLEDA